MIRSEFSYNDLKVLKSIVQEFSDNDFELFKTGELVCLKIWFDFDYLQELTSLSLQEGRLTDNYVILNLDKDEELQVNFKKSLVQGDRLFDIIKKPMLSKRKELKSVKLILQVIKDKKLMKKLDKVSKKEAEELSSESHGIFGDQKKNDKNTDIKSSVKEVEDKVEDKDKVTKEVEELYDTYDEEKSEISYDELSEVACKELYTIVTYKLGNIRKMIKKKVVDALVKSLYKFVIKQTINITIETAQIDKNESQEILSKVLVKCKEFGFYSKRKHDKHDKSNQVSKNPYIEFGKTVRPQIAKENPEMNAKEVLTLIAKMWTEKKIQE